MRGNNNNQPGEEHRIKILGLPDSVVSDVASDGSYEVNVPIYGLPDDAKLGKIMRGYNDGEMDIDVESRVFEPCPADKDGVRSYKRLDKYIEQKWDRETQSSEADAIHINPRSL